MTKELLAQVGAALHGPYWMTGLAADLKVATRTVKRWATGQYNIPEGVPGELSAIIKKRQALLVRLGERLE